MFGVSKSKSKQDLSTRITETTNVNIRDIGFTSKDAVALAAIITAGNVAVSQSIATPHNAPGSGFTPLVSGAGRLDNTQGTAPTTLPQTGLSKLFSENLAIVAAAAGVALVLYARK